MNIILFGPPGAGKGTQSKHLINKLNNYQISTGDILRDEIKKNTDIGKKIVNDMNDGIFVSDEIVNKLIEKFIFDPIKKNKLIFDGYPRSLIQAKNLDSLLNMCKPPIFWKEKPVVKKQLAIWNLNDLKEIVLDINNTEVLCKKNPQISNSIFFNFFLKICKKASSFS